MDNNKMIALRRIIFALTLLMILDDIGGRFHHDTLNFSHKNLKRVAPELPEGINTTTGITGVSYSYNSIGALKHDDLSSFCDFPNLRYLFFDHNDIAEVEASSFRCVPDLVYLDLSNNKLSALSDELCDELGKSGRLLYVNLKDNRIENFDFVGGLVKRGVEVDYDERLVDDNLLEFRVVKNRKRRVLPLDVDHNDTFASQNATEEVTVDISYENLTEAGAHGNITTLSDKYVSSIVFNFFAASLVLVVIPLSMFIYYCVSKCERGS